MKRRSNRISLYSIPVLLLVLLSLFANKGSAQAETGYTYKNLTWYVSTSGVLTVRGTGDMPNFPYNGTTPWDSKKQSINKIVIESGLTSVGDHAFRGFLNVTEISLPAGLVKIGSQAFEACIITDLIIPDTVKTISYRAFYNCVRLKNLTLTEGIETIGPYAFAGCLKLTDITLPGSLKAIQLAAFRYCTALEEISIPNGVTELGSYAFEQCSNLKNVSLPSGIKEINSRTFSECRALESISIPQGVKTIGQNAFENCSSLAHVDLPDSLTEIGGLAFHGCKALTEISIPAGVKTIGIGAFWTCSSLQNVTLPDGLLVIDEKVFRGCRSFTEIIIPDTVTAIGLQAFENCTGVRQINIPDSVTSIGDGAFMGCECLESVTVSESNQAFSLYDGALFDKALTRILWCPAAKESFSIPETVTAIDGYTFADCSLLESLSVSENVTQIGEEAFNSETTVHVRCNSYAQRYVTTNSLKHVTSGHGSAIVDAAIAPTCTNSGLSEGSHCSVCWETITSQQTIDALGHDWNSTQYTWKSDNSQLTASHVCKRDPSHTQTETVRVTATVTKQPNCEEAGIITYTSAAFTYEGFEAQTKDEVRGQALGHLWGSVTYTWSNGNTAVTAARTCGRDASHVEQETVPATSKVTKQPTCTESGKTTYTGAAFTNPAFAAQTRTVSDISALGHSVVTDPYVAPTDVHPGLTEGSHCKVCGEVLAAQSVLHPLVWEIQTTPTHVTITKYYGGTDRCSVPEKVDGVRVGSIESGVFPLGASPSKIYIPSGVDSISPTAFAGAVTVYCNEFSEADYWAFELNYPVVYVDDLTGGDFYVVTMPEDFTMEAGERRALGASVWPPVYPEGVRLESSNPACVAVQGQTLIAKASGRSTVTLSVGAVSRSVNVRVCVDPTDFAVLDEETLSGEVYVVTKRTHRLIVGGVSPAGAEFDLVWQSSNDGVAAVDQSGLVTAKRPGQAVITATAQNGLSRSCVVNVCYPATEIVFSQSEYSVGLGGVLQTTALVGTIGGTYENRFVTFTSSDEAILRVDAKTGVVRGVSLGTATLTAAADNGVSGTCTVTVREANTLVLPAGTTVIGSKAFGALSGVDVVVLPAGVSSIAPDAFGESNVVLSVAAGSYAESWAIEHGMPYTAR